ncbi:hypothetical protein NL676_007187 [Syzygium grande]|nr:hypothetical protein NL676_007187 [Syzygium grande]
MVSFDGVRCGMNEGLRWCNDASQVEVMTSLDLSEDQAMTETLMAKGGGLSERGGVEATISDRSSLLFSRLAVGWRWMQNHAGSVLHTCAMESCAFRCSFITTSYGCLVGLDKRGAFHEHLVKIKPCMRIRKAFIVIASPTTQPPQLKGDRSAASSWSSRRFPVLR